MNRDRTIAVVLALLLLVSLVGNWMLWQKSHGGAAPAVAAQPEGRKSATSREKGAQGVYELVANPEMKGRLGRVVIAYAEGVTLNLDANRTAFFKQDGAESIKSSYGPVAAEMPPGIYDLDVNGKKIAGIPVKSGQDTRVPSGLIRFHGASETTFYLYDVGVKEHFKVAYGNALVGLPAGDYEIGVSGQREKVTVEPGKVTDY